MRKEPTPAEQKLWNAYLRHLPFRVRRQCPFEGYILDFYIHAHKLVIEVDGVAHDTLEARAYNAERTKLLEAHGLKVVRLTNAQILHDFERVRTHFEALLRPSST